MRKVEEQMIAALEAGKNRKVGNTQVAFHTPHHWSVYLHGHEIATGKTIAEGVERITISDCGWQTVTTKSRLNALCRYLNARGISQCNWVWYGGFHPGEFDGEASLYFLNRKPFPEFAQQDYITDTMRAAA